MKRSAIGKFCLTIDDERHELDASQLEKLNQWLAGLAPRIDEIHRARGLGALAELAKARGEVYAGASGGNLTFGITPTDSARCSR